VSLAYYFDHHVPSAICDGLRAKAIDVLTTSDDATESWEDDAILQRATDLGRLVFTQDVDFLLIASHWAQQGRPFAGVVYGHQLRITIGQAIRDLELLAAIMTADEMRNRVEYLPLR
jgi:predicted nuclease of predicted toxin-antitoxin system